MKIFAETDRLILREILPSDVDAMFELDSDPEVHKYLGRRPVREKERVVETINFIRQQYIEHGIGRWAMTDKKTSHFMGWAGLKFVTDPINNHKNHYDLGYRLIRKYWGQGFATESAIASLAYGFDQLKINEIFAAAHTGNNASNRILKNVGLNMLETFTYDGAVHNWYRISQSEWNSTRPNR